MAEATLGGILGGEGEKPELEVPEPLAGAAAFASAVAAKLAGNDPGVARKTEEFLSDQSQLLKVQKKQLEEEHAARLHYLRGQAREVDIRRFGLRLRVAFQLFVALVATLGGVGIAVMLRDAFTSRSVVVEPFDAPPALAVRGVSGKFVAGGLLDELTRLQNATRSSAAKRNLSNAWTSDIKLAVPETGMSLSDVSRLLRARFGHDLHIDGALVQSESESLALTVRGDGVPPKTFAGTSGELDKLTTAAAEYVYAQSEPSLWAVYLVDTRRYSEAIAFCQAAFASADQSDRPYLLNYWADALADSRGALEEGLALYRAALKLKPDFWTAYSNVINSLWGQGNEEAAWRAGEDLRKAAGGRPGRAPEEFYQNWDTLTWNLPAWLESNVADANSHAGVGTANTTAGPAIADVEARLHDAGSAELALQTTRADDKDPTIAAITHFVRGRLAAEANDGDRAASEMEAFQSANVDPDIAANYPGYSCWVAPAEEAAGHPDRADSVLASAGRFVDCYRFRGDILDHRGNWRDAQRAYAAAVELAPDLPAGYYSWGEALARHGDLAGAESKLEKANQRGPHWADPLKAWGDTLVKRGHRKEAVAKYDEALKYAPNWAALKRARDSTEKQER